MPKIIDREERRAAIAGATLRVIGRVGVNGATVRAIAAEGGFSSGTLAHYFRDKDDVVSFAFEWIAQRDSDRIEQRIAKARTALERLRISLDQLVLDPTEPGGVATSIGFWSAAIGNETLVAIYERNYERWRNYIRRFLKEAIASGEIKKRIPLEDAVDLMISTIDGLCISMALGPARFSARRLRHLVDQLIESMTEITSR